LKGLQGQDRRLKHNLFTRIHQQPTNDNKQEGSVRKANLRSTLSKARAAAAICLVKILALQLKRIGDLILTTPALAALREAIPKARISLVVADACGELLPAIEGIERGLVFRRRELNADVWKAAFATRFDACLDFTGNDRSALLTGLSMARRRLTFEWVRKSKWRALSYHQFIASPVRERHTVDHYLDLAHGLTEDPGKAEIEMIVPVSPRMTLPASTREAARILAGESEFVVVHPGTARPEKYWIPERWAAVIAHLQERHGLRCIITGGAGAFEQEHIGKIQKALPRPMREEAGKLDLLMAAALIERARAVLSCDTAAVHLAAAFARPQIALYGPTNPFHWRPRHPHAIVLSAAHPEGALTQFHPRMKCASMDAISTELVIRATDCLLAMPSTPMRAQNQS
jgi:ADP-heptose:LPS heptosyltransferase